jgi:hypothetical protein
MLHRIRFTNPEVKEQFKERLDIIYVKKQINNKSTIESTQQQCSMSPAGGPTGRHRGAAG